METIDINNLAAAITEELQIYSNEVADGIKKSVDIVADEVNQEIKNHITFEQHTKKYVKSFRLKTSYEGQFEKRKTWYVANGQHRLTHLLEKGHALRQGGRTRAFPHIKYGEELAQKRMEELAREAIENANGR
ncbi:hypothetical protein EHE19_019175 [Ruminiclostridium herbifermentans]|uniref:HK97 gp10 family phage protein n=1 Tax=Ruminiclostridium herbifermentans TaxID=2488810 RepID=A0A4U7JDT2_9FIRM|nr:hypothetical protein [Ruminiclostridium herbifermentans]QNU66919.1 hypothetical protein EHE19_019175 [Ruminiclostridium herbifermentans]